MTPQIILTNEYASLILLVNGLAILFYFAARKKANNRAMKFGNYETLEKVAGKKFLHSSELILLLRITALTCLLIGISSPLLVQEGPSTDSDYVIALDSSSSMLTSDLEPNRLIAAQDISAQFVEELPEGSQVGLITYSGEVENQTGLTSDRDEIISEIRSQNQGTVAGTSTGDAIIAASSTLSSSNNDRDLILVTDGRNNQGANMSEATSFAQSNNVSVNPIGIGETEDEEDEEDPELNIEEDPEQIDFAGFPNLEEETLSEVANATGGEASLVSDREGFETAFEQISSEEYETDISSYFILAGAFLLLLEWIMSTTRIKILP